MLGIFFIIFFSFLDAKTLFRPFVATYIKEQSFPYSKHKVYTSGVIFFNIDKVAISEQTKRVGNFLMLNGRRAVFKTIYGDRVSTKKLDTIGFNGTLLRILRAKSLSFTVKNKKLVRYYFVDKGFKYAILEKVNKTGYLNKILYQDRDGTINKIEFYWFKFL